MTERTSSEAAARREGGTEGDQPPTPGPDEPAARFREALGRLGVPADARLGLAVSGGPDSLALLLIAADALPGRIEAATVDHGLRAGSHREAEEVARLCADLGVPHALLAPGDQVTLPAAGSLQMRARTLRYALLEAWAARRSLPVIATAHHLDDQAETVLMRIARGSGTGGMAGIRPLRSLGEATLIRPLLGWRRHDLAALVAARGLVPVDDPANRDPRHDRTQARALLRSTPWLSALRLAAIADHARDAEDALAWIVEQLWAAHAEPAGGGIRLAVAGLPRELRLRLLLRAAERLASPGVQARPDRLAALLDRVEAGHTATAGSIKVVPGPAWLVTRVPAHRGGNASAEP